MEDGEIVMLYLAREEQAIEKTKKIRKKAAGNRFAHCRRCANGGGM